MSPFDRARWVYAQEPCARTFEQDLMLHYLHGFVFSTPDYFVMGRPVVKEADPALIINPAHTFPVKECNAWHVYLAAGDLSKAWDIMLWPLGSFTFERRNELRCYSMERIRRLSRAEVDLIMP